MKSEHTSADAAPTPARPARAGKSGAGETVRFLLLLFLFALLLRTFVAAPFFIPSGSMLPRMMIGDFLFVAKWPYGFSRFSFPVAIDFGGRILERIPARGDVAVFREQTGEDHVVKRLVGLPGDTIQMVAGQLVLNGKPVPKIRIADYLAPRSPNMPCRYASDEAAQPPVQAAGETYCRYTRFREKLPGGRSYEVLDQGASAGDDTEVFTVPEGHYFMLGDNRDDSADSRFPQERDGVGFLPADHLIGRAMIVFFSTDGSAEWTKPWTWFSAARPERIGGTF